MDASPTPPKKTAAAKIRAWGAAHPRWTLTLLTVAALLPFLAKPFNMDDPLFVWAAQQIQAHPVNFYGFAVNWYGVPQPMWAATQNPPLMSYYLAVSASLLGWSETSLHLACLLPAVAVVLGTYRLAQKFCRWPMLAAGLTLVAPGFFVSATTVMCDVAMLALWVWAVVFWTEGIRENSPRQLFWAGVLLALALLTKFNSLCLLPLLAAHGWLAKRNIGRWWIFLLIPVVALGGYEWLTFQLYGEPHFYASNHFAQNHQTFHGWAKFFKILNALTFTGGCSAAMFFCAPLLWRKKTLAILATVGTVLLLVALAGGVMEKNFGWLTGWQRTNVELQMLVWLVGGLAGLALASTDVWQKRDADAWLLWLWVTGTFLFAALVYWMVNARVVLPMVPAVAILMVRGLEANRPAWPAPIKFPIAASLILSLLAAQADFHLANNARKGAEQISAAYAGQPGKIWFEGHWGFQYYLQACGGEPLNYRQPDLHYGDLVIQPDSNSNMLPPAALKASRLADYTAASFPGFATLDAQLGASFYSDIWGPLPFAFGRTRPEMFHVLILKKPLGNNR
jgi:4-amino-4-deoxy-L-arabinose transferase-like glycosyltransferase